MNRQSTRPSLTLLAGLLVSIPLFATSQVQAQTCQTDDCSSSPPAGCQDRAAPRTLRVEMSDDFVFIPNDPRIEPGECIEWDNGFLEHTSTGSSDNVICNDTVCAPGLCDPLTCDWDTGNVAGANSVFCFYDAACFGPDTTEAYCCRFHFLFGMTGNLKVTSAIQLALDKSGNDVVLDWTGGGIPGDETFKVLRSTDDPTLSTLDAGFPADPDVGAPRKYTDLNELSNKIDDRYYLVRNKQVNE